MATCRIEELQGGDGVLLQKDGFTSKIGTTGNFVNV